MSLIEQIKEYYEKRELRHPNIWQALAWLQTELAEVYELIMDREGGWVRNNPDSKPKFSKEDLAEELGDIIFMCIVAGIEEGVDPIGAMENKMRRKLGKPEVHVNPVSTLEVISDGTASWYQDPSTENIIISNKDQS